MNLKLCAAEPGYPRARERVVLLGRQAPRGACEPPVRRLTTRARTQQLMLLCNNLMIPKLPSLHKSLAWLYK